MKSLITDQFQSLSYMKNEHLSEHLTSNNLLNAHQSAYFKHHSTETA